MRRTLFCLCGIVALIVIAYLAVNAQVWQPKRVPQEPSWAAGVPREPSKYSNVYGDQRVLREIEELDKLSLEEALDMLEDLNPYILSPVKGMISHVYEGGDGGRYQFNSNEQAIVLSNRLLRKCLQEIKQLSPKEASRLIENQLDTTLVKYTELRDQYIRAQPEPFPVRDAAGNIVHEAEASIAHFEFWKKRNALMGTRYKLLGLLFIAGACELTDCYAAVSNVANIALESIGNVQANPSALESLWQPHFLATAVYGTNPRKNDPAFRRIAARFTENQLAGYDARRTEYESKLGVTGPMGGTPIKLRYFASATDEDVLTLLRVAER